jgi:biopolymer transport protein TolR
MARKTPFSSLRQMSEINLTPMMDLTFLLLITFIITFPLVEQGIPVNLPKASAREVTSDKARTITLDMKGGVYLDDVPVSVDELRARVFEIVSADAGVSIMVRADERLAYGKVVEILKILHQANVVKMALVTESES